MKSNYRNKPKGYKCFVTPAVSEVRFCIFFPREHFCTPGSKNALWYFGKKKFTHQNGPNLLPNDQIFTQLYLNMS